MYNHNHPLAALIGSRICHDLTSPIGAVTNGLELLELSGMGASPEMTLILDSAADANARIRLFRLAFGTASASQSLRAEELRDILCTIYRSGRVTLVLDVSAPLRLPLAQILVLSLLCAEQSIPYGGTLSVTQHDDRFTVSATGARLQVNVELWNSLEAMAPAPEVTPAQVQFLLLPERLAALGRSLQIERGETELRLTF
ncbi:histidine phosphotransferase family protein [Roseovarius sp.]|uniref:histidine phosphotransferase family protein n=1 Tax=Roseovarius sp. TaxID=1486281 RepID=UPI00260E5E96|nr:histidine phosphotransferase family protein [Roseovarius sp.]